MRMIQHSPSERDAFNCYVLDPNHSPLTYLAAFNLLSLGYGPGSQFYTHGMIWARVGDFLGLTPADFYLAGLLAARMYDFIHPLWLSPAGLIRTMLFLYPYITSPLPEGVTYEAVILGCLSWLIHQF